jgi:hypothetical protein
MSILAMVLALPFLASGLVAQKAPQPAPESVHVVLVNMSGNSREVKIGRSVVSLPVGQRVPLTVHRGEPIAVMSATDTKVDWKILVQSVDDGRVIPVR